MKGTATAAAACIVMALLNYQMRITPEAEILESALRINYQFGARLKSLTREMTLKFWARLMRHFMDGWVSC
jgi:hypothetical protein